MGEAADDALGMQANYEDSLDCGHNSEPCYYDRRRAKAKRSELDETEDRVDNEKGPDAS